MNQQEPKPKLEYENDLDENSALTESEHTADGRNVKEEECEGIANGTHTKTKESKCSDVTEHERQGNSGMDGCDAVSEDNVQMGNKNDTDNEKDMKKNRDEKGTNNKHVGKERNESGGNNGEMGLEMKEFDTGVPEAGHEKTLFDKDKVQNGQQRGGRTRGKDQKPRRSEQDNDGTSDESKYNKIKELEEKIREQEKNKERMNVDLKKERDEVSSLKTARELEHKDLTAKITELETNHRTACATIKKKDTMIEELDKKNKKLDRKLIDVEKKLDGQKTANVELCEKQIKLQQLNDTLKKELKETRKIVKEQKAEITQKTNHSQQQGVWLQQQGQQIQQQDQQIQQYISYSNNLEKDLADSKDKRHELTLRLSKLAGAQLTSNNPNIADLSDTNRPTKIAERYSELYDNEWTDAYEDLSESSGTDEQTRINELLKLLKASYDECVQLSEPFRNTLESLTTVTLRVKGDQECHNRDETKQDQETMTTAVDKLVQTSLDHVGHGALKAGKHDGNHEEARSEEKMETDALENQASPQTDVQPTFSDKDSENVENQPGEAMDVESEGQNTSNKDDNNVKTSDNLSCEKKQGQGSTGSPKTEAATGDEHSLGNHTTDGAVPHVDGSPSPVSQVDERMDPLQGQRTEQNLEHREPTTGQTNPQPGYSSDVDTGQQGPNTDESSKTEAAIEDKHSIQNHNTDGAVSPVDDTTLLVSQATGKTNIPPGFSSNVDTGEITAEVKVEVEFTAELRKNVSDMKRMCGRKLEEEMGLSKAIAQKIALERNIDAEKHERIIAYITKCAELCWFMMIQEPPVFIGFNDVKTGEPFNKDVYKAYTKTGKQLDYIVWPPLYLHKGGPMLSKGVAQGAN